MVEYKKKTLAKQHKCSSAIKTVCGKQEVELRTKKRSITVEITEHKMPERCSK